jgi:hypothetical protein
VSKEFSDIWVPIIYDGVITLDEKEVVLYEDAEKGMKRLKLILFFQNTLLKCVKE